ncbi:hypothetical protein PVAND_016534 [Polypedilum vanderplanki]|uniref:DOMON domain-containing protein n=1 Tax=Polypedilum vanderplanki TaxID=319348 RepID=A0A9J6BGK0_POLVA|nr:hypothetical protein PVAND_016534 [Polypedilum vanderplanki]
MILPYWLLAFFNITRFQEISYKTGELMFKIDPIYDGCSSTKVCVGYPKKCVRTKSCNAFGSYEFKDGKHIFEMRSSSNAAYIATALSFDRRMGDDSAMECVKDGSQVKTFSSYTIREKGNYDAIRYGIPQEIIRLNEGRIDNGAVYCKIERDEVSTVSDVKFDLKNDKFYLLLATGNKVASDRIKVHNLGHGISENSINA